MLKEGYRQNLFTSKLYMEKAICGRNSNARETIRGKFTCEKFSIFKGFAENLIIKYNS
jgi:hypothetical protein